MEFEASPWDPGASPGFMSSTPTTHLQEKLPDYEVCVGRFCFLQPYPSYVPPPFYRRLPDKNYKWKVAAKVTSELRLRLKIQRAWTIPNCFGLGDDARWQWQWIPYTLVGGIKIESSFQRSCDCSLLPYIHLRSLTPIFGRLALQPVLEILPIPALIMRREFLIGHSTFALQANFEVANLNKARTGPQWAIKLDWYPTDTVTVQSKTDDGALAIRYSREFSTSQNVKFKASAITKIWPACSKLSFPVQLKLQSVKVSRTMGTTCTRDTPLTRLEYLNASKGFGKCDRITVVPGHWIDPGFEQGAPGERDFNLEVANVLERELRANGWEVLRPDRDAPHLSWIEYLNWVSIQTQKGIPVLEIHGQVWLQLQLSFIFSQDPQQTIGAMFLGLLET